MRREANLISKNVCITLVPNMPALGNVCYSTVREKIRREITRGLSKGDRPYSVLSSQIIDVGRAALLWINS